MGNCLDLPPPPPKDHKVHHRYSNGVKHSGRSSHRSKSVSSVSMARMSDSYSLYQPYPLYFNEGPPKPLIVTDPNTGQSYSYPPPMPISPYPQHPRDPYAESYYDYYDYGVDYEYHKKTKKHRHRKQKEIADTDQNANRKTTLITTFPDPSDDVIVQGDGAMPSRVTTVLREQQLHSPTTAQGRQAASTEVITASDTAQRSTVISTETSQRVTSEVNNGHVDIEEVQIRPNEPTTTSITPAFTASDIRPTRGTTYVTYIKDVPMETVVAAAAPPMQAAVVEHVTQRTNEIVGSSQHEASVVVVETGAVSGASLDGETTLGEATTLSENGVRESKSMFVERSGPVEDVNRLLVDEPLTDGSLTVTDTGTTTVTRSTTDVVTSRHITSASGSLLLQGGFERPDLPVPDVVVVGAASDEEFIRRIAESLRDRDMSVFVSMASPLRSEQESFIAGQMIIDTKILVVVLSVRSGQSGQLRDEVSLACASNTAIFPVAIDQSLDILDDINVALKLQVASYKWVMLRDQEHPTNIILDLFVNSVSDDLEFIKSNPDIIDEDFGQVSNRANRRLNLLRRRQMMRMIPRPSTVTAAQFWNETYPDQAQVEWSKFRQDFMQRFRSHLNGTLPRHGQLRTMDCLRRELVSDDQNMIVTKGQFVVFCSDEGQDEDLWEKFLNLARDNLAIRDVFDVESTVRLVAIQNIGRFGSPAVMSTLRDLLSDQDANIRAVATISLSRCTSLTDEVSFKLLLSSLDDGDRLVREAGCIAMGHLKATAAVPKLTDMWRNDVISHVREAASAALQEIGGDQAGEAIRVTKILADEIRTLT